jgi:hypothetical protein
MSPLTVLEGGQMSPLTVLEGGQVSPTHSTGRGSDVPHSQYWKGVRCPPLTVLEGGQMSPLTVLEGGQMPVHEGILALEPPVAATRSWALQSAHESSVSGLQAARQVRTKSQPLAHSRHKACSLVWAMCLVHQSDPGHPVTTQRPVNLTTASPAAWLPTLQAAAAGLQGCTGLTTSSLTDCLAD